MTTARKTKPTAPKCQKFGISEKGHQWLKDNGYDGHSIYREDGVPFRDLGLEKSDRDHLVRKFTSDLSDWKSTITHEGKVVSQTEGVYLLDLWKAIARRMKLDDALARAGMLFGRGSQARVLCDAILAELE